MSFDHIPKRQACKIFESAFTEGSIILTKHITEQMKERDIDMNDILSVKDTGIIQREPDHDIKTGWKYTIRGKDVEGKPLEVAFSIQDKSRVVLISAWRCK